MSYQISHFHEHWPYQLGLIFCIVLSSLGIHGIQSVRAADKTVNTLLDENDGSCLGDCSLRDAIALADPGDTIDFSVQGTITLTMGELLIDKNLNIDGDFAGKLTISGGGSSRVFKIGLGKIVTLTGVTIADGSVAAKNGGGIYNNTGLLTLNQCTVEGNSSLYHGGGIYTWNGTVTINESTISGNNADNGAGIYNFNADVILNNSTISGNDSNGGFDGGGIYNWDGTITLNHTTVTGNSVDSGDGGGIYNHLHSGSPIIYFNNSLIAGNLDSSGAGAEDCYNDGGILTSQDYNLTGSGTGCGLTGTHDQTTADALLLPLAYNSGGTQTHALDAGSPAINQIPPGTNGCGITYLVDQRGMARPQGLQCDIGAFEVEISPNDTISMYSPPQKTWYLKEVNDDGWSNVQTFRFGSTDTSWVPVVGDWDEDGADTIGIYSPGQKTWYLKDANNDGWGNVTTVRFGSTDSSWIPVVGDWDTNGTDTIAIYSRSQKTWYLKDANTDGWGDVTTVRFGSTDTSWIPVAGDWNGNGTDTIAIYSRTQKTWYLKDTNTDGWGDVTTVRFGSTDSSWIPVVGDWNGNGTDTIAMYSRTQKTWYLKGGNTDGWGDVTTVRFGSIVTSWAPVEGKWTMSP